ncbi:hypothetical protein LWE61_14020 [Sphingobium sufflavum]|uniref:hypothetical protein n=1 Tax=Sphingobium sufflavum TaxID=1129547 RepID=UPI001F41ADDC|nr:hypothetical protein [Sphingobium sufflavum]MCE7797665.1 hypothetical protein [Sphingobium sufflavum]
MTGYSVSFDAARGIVLCRISPSFRDEQLPALSRELGPLVDSARAAGPLRALWDNRAGRVLAPATAAAVRAIFVGAGAPQDRIAVVVADSMAKARARPSMDATSQLFASENAALTWLSVGGAAAA